MSEEEKEDTMRILEYTDISRIELAENVDLRTYQLAVNNLLDLYKQEKEKNKKLIQGRFREVADKNAYIKDMYISKDKIKEKLQNYIISYNDIESNFETTAQQYDTLKELDIKIEILEELLEEK